MRCLFCSDLHGNLRKYQFLFEQIELMEPDAVFLGGDLLPSGLISGRALDIEHRDFINGFLRNEFKALKQKMKKQYPEIFLIMGNDDPRFYEISFLDPQNQKYWHYVHNKKFRFNDFEILGYSFIPPSPFQLKDWEKYDVSRYVDVGSTHPYEGHRSFPTDKYHIQHSTIKKDLEKLAENVDMENTVFLFHAPPYKTVLDRADLDGKMIDYVPLDVHVGSIAIRDFILEKRPFVTLHGHVHESSRLTGKWKDKIGRTCCFQGAYENDGMAVIIFDTDEPHKAKRNLFKFD